MNNNSPPEAQFSSESTTINHGFAPYAGAFFSKSQNFTVSGSTLTSVTHNHTSIDVPSDFRRIPFGNINLKHEMRLHRQSGIVNRYHVHGSVRRMYSARIFGEKSDMTVVVYQGDDAEEEWRDAISRYSRLRHPNVLQIFAIARSAGIHAIVVHDDLIPFYDFLQLHRDAPILTIYIYAFSDRDHDEAAQYFQDIFHSRLDADNSTCWIRPSTGRLCVELSPGDVAAPDWYPQEWTPSFDHIPPLKNPNSETMLIDSLQLGEYHQAELHLGAVMYSPSDSDLDASVEIAFLPNVNNPYISSWYCSRAVRDIMEDGWTRYNAAKIFGTTICSSMFLTYPDQMAWFSQANHIFRQLQIKSNYEDFACIRWIDFRLRIPAPRQTPPTGYLFVCQTRDLQTGPASFQWPDRSAYWSLDPSGAKRLTTEEAMYLGFPSINLEAEVRTKCWDAHAYAGFRKFYKGKGFDPDSQDVALHLGHHLYQVSSGMEMPFAHTVDKISDAETSEISSLARTEDYRLHESTNLGYKCVLNLQQFFSLDVDETAPQSWTWKFTIFFELGLILALGLGSLCKYGWAVLSQ